MQRSRRLRGMIGLAVTWGLALSALTSSLLGLGLAGGLVPSSVFGPREIAAVAFRALVVGVVSGGLFGWLMASRERGRSLATLSRRRVALWGFASAGAVIPVLGLTVLAFGGPALPLSVLAAATVLAGLGGSLFGAGLLWSARRAPAQLLDRTQAADTLLP